MSKMRKPQQDKNQGYILRLRQSRTLKGISMTLALSLLFEMIQPTVSMALTEGPSQPEVQSFEPIGTTQMVDLFTGDFNYNIPLFNLPGPNGGYPVNIAYHAGVSMDDEASWVGLGWNLNVGSLVRNMRGLPDEFLSTVDSKGEWNGGDFIETKTDMKASWTLGANWGKKFEVFGGDVLKSSGGFNLSISYNNFRGLGASVGGSYGIATSPFSYGLSLDSDNGLGVSAQLNLTRNFYRTENDFKLGLSFNGSPSLTYSLSKKEGIKQKIGRNGQNAGLDQGGIGSSLSYARGNFVPSIGNKMNSYSISGSFSFGIPDVPTGVPPGIFTSRSVGIFFNTQDFNNTDKTGRKRPVVGYAEAKAGQMDFTKDFVRQNDGQITKESSMLPHSYYAHDAYNSSGQGLSGYFRGRRNDVGKVHDPRLRNVSWGASLDFEAAALTGTHLGLGATISSGWDGQLPWNKKNELNYDFDDPRPDDGIQENLFYQAHGEQTIVHPNEIAHMRGTELALVQFEPKNTNIFTGGKREIKYNYGDNHLIKRNRAINITDDADRVVRNTLIHTLKNEEVGNLGEFQIGYYDYDLLNADLDFSITPPHTYNRGSRTLDVNHAATDIGNHNAGYKVLNEDGSYYVYGLPAYNTKEVENLFSVDTPTDPSDFLYHNQANTVKIDTISGEVDYKRQGTHKMINKTTKSPYAHSYMLTSVQGADYVDLENDGPSDDDLGYWVKFDYVKYGDNIKWRAPFHGANYSQGQTYTGQDDKGSYQYGEKEQWYLGRMETKSHIAIFEMSERSDMKEAAGEFVNASDATKMGSKSGLKIDKIKIYEKESFYNPNPGDDPIPLQVVNFEYDYSLCPGVLNNDDSAPTEIYEYGDMDAPYGNVDGNQGGKLTLKRVYFTSLNSKRGTMSPYEFDYTSVATPSNYNAALLDSAANNLVNPSYQQNAYDPWGGYRPYATYASNGNNNGTYDGGYQQHSNFPYVAQTSQGWMQQWSSLYAGYPNHNETKSNKKLTQQANDLIASTWSLKQIKLPSGGKINIEYESDDYSHVQHKVANQMFRIVKMGDYTAPDQLYQNVNENNDYHNPTSFADEHRRRIYFKLEKPIKVGLSNVQYADSIMRQYVTPIMRDEAGKRNLYYKSRMRLTFNANDNNVYDYVRGYLPLEESIYKTTSGATYYNYGVLQANVSAGNTQITAQFTDEAQDYYSIGYVTIEPAKRKNGNFFDQYHPMALAAWTYMQTNAQELLNPSSTMNSISEPSNTGEVLGLLTNVLNVVPATAASFGAIRPYCKNENFAQFIDLDNSGIRLASPDRKKIGGGHRVKQITITDEWESDTDSQEDSRTYGQVYDYTTKEDGMTMSSGVAQYEPQAGGDENALKYPIYFYGKNKMFTNNNLFAEAPMNEALFPGAMVGYRKVTVRSLNTSKQMKNALPNSPTAEGRTGGISEHEFYTGKEFPTMVEWSPLSESNHTKDVFNLPIPIPFIGSIKRNYYHGSQAFKIELNDMHGKPKSVKTYELNNYARNSAPITEAFYEYQSKPIVYQGEQVRQLVSEVQVIPESGIQDLTNTESRLMGVETDLFTDQRESKSLSTSGGLDFNADIIGFLPIPSFWPSFSNHKTMFRTYVTNKVVHRSGILVKTKTRDLQTTNETEILAYDEKAGTPLVSKVKNEFGDNFYSYNVPAYYHYDRMGHAYRNINFTFVATVQPFTSSGTGDKRGIGYSNIPASNIMIEHLVRGDELLVNGDGHVNTKAYFLGWAYDGGTTYAKIQFLSSDGSVHGGTFHFKVIRSGRRNHYGSMAANYLTKGEISTLGSQYLDGTVGNIEYVSTPIIAENVLSATASLFKDDWVSTGGDANLNLDGSTNNPFLSGNSGIWRPFKSYTYVGSRSGKASMDDNTTVDPELYNDGVMSSVPMFTWDLGNIEDYDLNWEWVNEVTRFSQDAYEVENVNRLGIYSSALYGYDNSLTIAVGGNASTYELGAYDFELPSGGASLLSQTNMDFNVNQVGGNVLTTDQYKVINAEMGANNELTILTNIPATGFSLSDYESNIGLTLNTRKGVAPKTNEGFYFNADLTGFSTYPDGNETFVKLTAVPFIETGVPNYNLLPEDARTYGKVTLMSLKSNVVMEDMNASYTLGKAHTGKGSLRVTGLTKFDQPQLKIIKNKKYIVSLWVSADKKKRTYENNGIVQLNLLNNPGDLNILKTTYSKVIEGWQKVDIEFKVNGSNKTLLIQLNMANGETSYVDDIRFSPATGGITTYVYDPTRFWLRASLNVDNYATLFFYDEEGNLTVKKQETEEGIFTITESRGHVSE